MPSQGPSQGDAAEFDRLDLGEYLGPDGSIARIIPDYEPRPSQLAMAEAVRAALLARGNALIEAPTGTGKSLAYLVPALLSGRRVVVATANKSLQQQLYAKDVPLASRIIGREVEAVLVKGRSNYLCPWKWDQERVERQMLAAIDGEDDQVRQLETWSKETRSGDIDELPILLSPDLRARVVSFTDDCIQQACPYWDDACFVNQMRDAAAGADVVITNHHLLLTALQLGEGGERILPPAPVYVIDEAHHLVDTATAVFEAEVSDHSVESLLARKIYREHLDTDEVDDLRFEARLAFDEVERLRLAAGESGDRSGAFRIEVDLPRMQGLARSLKARAQSMQDLHPYRARKAAAATAVPDPDWPFDEPSPAERDPSLLAMLEGSAEDASLARVYDLAVSNLSSLADKLAAVASSRQDGRVVRYVEPVYGRRHVRMLVHAAPITPAQALAQHLFGAERRSVICTSATLSAGAGFEHFKIRCGAERISRELIVPPVFDYPSQALLYQPKLRAYSWNRREAYYEDVAGEIARLLELSRGRALCLFTSWSGLQHTRALLDPAGAEASEARRGSNRGGGDGDRSDGDGAAAGLGGRWTDSDGDEQPAGPWPRSIWPLRAQGDAPRDALLAWFRDTPHSVLLATRSFWEGVDIPGEDLSLVVLDKLPFPSPGDPLHAARMRAIEEAESSSFGAYMLPLMTLTLKQGFGRLIRRASDHGVVAILDERLSSKSYGHQVRRDLPDARFHRDFAAVQAFYQSALESEADFALNLRARPLSDSELEGFDLGDSGLTGEQGESALDRARPVAWWWQLVRLIDGRSDAHEGIETDLSDEISGAFHAAVLGLEDLARRVERAGRATEEFAVEIRADARVTGWMQDAAELPEDATGALETARPSRLVGQIGRWRKVEIRTV